MYKSPIDIIYGQMETQMEGDILRAVQKYGINVDKEELVRALNYDREQYYNGYADGRNDALADLVRCKDCKWYAPNNDGSWLGCAFDTRNKDDEPKADDFCSYGEKKENNNG